MTTTLYRFFDASDQLIYVGITGVPYTRWEEHRSRASWWTAATSVRLEHFTSRRAAELAERRAIEGEGPLHNLRHAPVDKSAPDYRQKWRRVADEIRQRIRDGDAATASDGSRRLPTYAQLMEQHDAGYGTLRTVLIVLEAEGWITRRPGKDLMVREDHP